MNPGPLRLMALLVCLPLVLLAAQEASPAEAQARQDAQQLLRELVEFRAQVNAARPPLAGEVRQLDAEVLGLSREVERRKRLRDSAALDLAQLEREVRTAEEELRYVEGLLSELEHAVHSRMPLLAHAAYAPQLQGAAWEGALGDFPYAPVLASVCGYIESALLPRRLQAKVLTQNGQVVEGRALLLGPFSAFTSEDGQHAGLLIEEVNVGLPILWPMSGSHRTEMTRLLREGKGSLPVDPTGGLVLTFEQQRETWIGEIRKGRWVGYVILMLGVIAAGTVLWKAREIAQARTPKEAETQAILNALRGQQKTQALEMASLVSKDMEAMTRLACEHGNAARSLLEEAYFARLLQIRQRLERGLPFLAMVAAAAPLMGLLGTVTGMIRTFDLITIYGAGDARHLSSGISEALITTKFGLMVAIPVLLAHGLLLRLARRKLAHSEQVSLAMMDAVCHNTRTPP